MLRAEQIPLSLQAMVDRELDPGERITWMQMPVARYFTAGSIAAFVFAIPWTAFAIFWMVMASQGSTIFSLFGIPFVLIGIGLLLSPVWNYRAAKKTIYVITDKRAITIHGGTRSRIQSYLPDRLRDLRREERPDGSGDVIVEQESWTTSKGHTRTRSLGFLGVQNAKEVEDLLEELSKKAT
ncbi:MAG: hypothetical protein ACI8UO_000586 [Verrucomicrobiales bacterium]|jgi:hypothetical protein